MAAKPGISTSSVSTTLDGYSAMITRFSATQRDMATMNGVLGAMLTPWGQAVPVSCTSDRANSVKVQTLCEQVITSVQLRR